MGGSDDQDRISGQLLKLLPRVSRRSFLRGSGMVVAGGIAAVSGRQEAHAAQEAPAATPVATGNDPVPVTPATIPPPSLRFFRPDQAELVGAITARLIPGTPDDPGAREAGVVYYIDGLLAHGDGFARPTYRQGPWAMTYEGEQPPTADQSGGIAAVWVRADQIDLYGFQSRLTPREFYLSGLPALNQYATERFGSGFVALSGQQQDQVLAALEDGEAPGFTAPTAGDFFAMLLDHTTQGFFSDPVYGGNRGMVGWKLVGFPGAQRAYSPREMKTEGTERQPMSMADLDHFHPGRPEEGPVLPVRGGDEDE